MPRFASVQEESERRVPQETSWSIRARMDFSSTLCRAMAPVGRGNSFGCGWFCCGSAGSRGADCCAKAGEKAIQKQTLAAKVLARSVRCRYLPLVIECAPQKECVQQSGILA